MLNRKDFESYFKDKKVLITGNTGFKGSWLSLYLHFLGAHVYGLSRNDNDNTNMYNACNLKDIVSQYYADITDFNSVKTAVNTIQPDIVFHMAAQAITLKGYEDPLYTFQVNGMGTANILDCFKQYPKDCQIVVVTSDKCYKNNEWVWGYRETDTLSGLDPYSASKSVAEIITQSYYHSFFKHSNNIKIVSCRAGNVIGGGDWSKHRIIPDCIKSWKNNQSIEIRNPDSIRPWNYILDVLYGYLTISYQLSQKDFNGEAFNFGPNKSSEIDVLEMVNELWEFWPKKEFNPYILIKNNIKLHEHQYLRLNIDKSMSLLNWTPLTQIKDALRQSVEWYNSYYENPNNILDFSLFMIKEYHVKI